MSELIERLREEARMDGARWEGCSELMIEAAAALEAEQRGRIVGSRAIDGLHVIVASAFTPGVEEQLLVRYDHYLAALEAAREDVARMDWMDEHGAGVRRRDNSSKNLLVWNFNFLGQQLHLRQAIDQARGKEQEMKA